MPRTFGIMRLAAPFCVILLALGTKPAMAQTACQTGESELIVVLPNGGERVICVPDAAISGLESAADHSPGNIVATQCPCFNTLDVQAMFDDATSGDECFRDDTNSLISCNDLNADFSEGSDFTATVGTEKVKSAIGYPLQNPMCGKFIGGQVSFVVDLSSEQLDACFATLEAFLPSP